ncbi:MAG: hypothetical protein R3C11_11875 [Planctomycetaceae bacterium]
MNNYGKKANFKDATPNGDDFREGLTAIITVRISILSLKVKPNETGE